MPHRIPESFLDSPEREAFRARARLRNLKNSYSPIVIFTSALGGVATQRLGQDGWATACVVGVIILSFTALWVALTVLLSSLLENPNS